MTNFISTYVLTSAAFGIAAFFSVLSFNSSAEGSSVFRCEGSTAKKVVSCCQEMTREHRPFWMVRSGKNCAQLVGCHVKKAHSTSTVGAVAAAAPVIRCYVKLDNENPNDGGNPSDGGGTKRGGGRGPNNPSSTPN